MLWVELYHKDIFHLITSDNCHRGIKGISPRVIIFYYDYLNAKMPYNDWRDVLSWNPPNLVKKVLPAGATYHVKLPECGPRLHVCYKLLPMNMCFM